MYRKWANEQKPLAQQFPGASVEYLAKGATLSVLQFDGVLDPDDETSMASLYGIVEATVGAPVDRQVVSEVARKVFDASKHNAPFEHIVADVLSGHTPLED